jgi:putative DNA-invertase from lambdoid prophage Rac
MSGHGKGVGNTTPAVRAAIYARVSTSDQTCEAQLRELREYCERRGWSVHAEYVDTGWSGAKASRPELDRLMRDAAMRRFDAVLVYKLDRFGRSVRNCLDGIEALRVQGVRFLAVSQSIDTDESNPTSRLLLHILASVAEFERELIRERVLAGLRSAKARGTKSGLPIGRPQAIFDRAKVVELRNAGESWRQIADALGVAVRTVRRVYAFRVAKPDGHERPSR